MPSQFAKYRADGDTQLSPEWWNRIVGDIDARLVGLEDAQASVDDVIDELVQIGLTRINEVLLPAFHEVGALASLGDLLRASSASEVTIGTGPVTWIIDAADRARFAAPLFVIAAVSGTTDQWMAGQVTAWDAETGALQVDVTNTRGTGTYASWDISVASIPPEAPPAQSADNVTVTPAGGLAATNVQDALAELDAEKADAAATQTALNGKSDVGHGHVIGDVTGLQGALDAKAPLASPAFTGTPTAPTADSGDNSTRLATTAFVQGALAGGGIIESSYTQNGYVKFADGLIIQWGYADDDTYLINFPIAFPTAVFAVTTVADSPRIFCRVHSLNASSFGYQAYKDDGTDASSTSDQVYWIAIGH